MRKKCLALFCVLFAAGLFVGACAQAVSVSSVQKETIVENCDNIKEALVNVQHDDSRTRVYFGRYYETILNKYITPLNVRLVENNLSNNELIDNQNNFVNTRTNFIIDYIEYQKVLEGLVSMDCKAEPAKFYEKLEDARLKRSIVAEDVAKLKTLAEEQVNLVTALEETL